MSEQGEGTKKVSILAEQLIGDALVKSAQEFGVKALNDLSRGAIDQANENLRRGVKVNAQALTHLTSPRLTEDENKTWLAIQERKYIVHENGMITGRILDKTNEEILRRLQKKAFGTE